MIVITGAAGFIGSYLAGYLNEMKYFDLVLVDDFSRKDKLGNPEGKRFTMQVDREALPKWLEENHEQVQFVFHLGARTDTAEKSTEIFNHLNLEYSQKIWRACTEYGIPLVYASSAATYGDGELGYKDDHALPEKLKPLNPYGVSKNDFDKWVLKQEKAPRFWAGLKFFNVYGPNEYHKGRMASVVYHAYNQVVEKGRIRLFRSHNPDFADGEQKRDFIYVRDIAKICYFLMHNRKPAINGIYNAGTGKAETFIHLAESVFNAIDKRPEIEYIDTPADIRDTYQYYTCADMGKLKRAGYNESFTSLEAGIKEYIREFLKEKRYY